LSLNGMDSRVFGGKKLIAIGSKTSAALNNHGLFADYIPEKYVAEGIVEVLGNLALNNKRILIPRAEIARDILPVKLGELGAIVDVVPCYKTIIPKYKKSYIDRMNQYILNGNIDVITFTSSSTVNNFFKILGNIDIPVRQTKIACIGPVTARSVALHELTPHIIAEKYTIEGIIESIIGYYENDK